MQAEALAALDRQVAALAADKAALERRAGPGGPGADAASPGKRRAASPAGRGPPGLSSDALHLRRLTVFLEKVAADERFADAEVSAVQRGQQGRRGHALLAAAPEGAAADAHSALVDAAVDAILTVRGRAESAARRLALAEKELEQHRRGAIEEKLQGRLREAGRRAERAEAAAREAEEAARRGVAEAQHAARVQALQERAAADELVESLRDEAAVVCNSLGAALKRAGERDKALGLFRRALQHREARRGAAEVELAPVLVNLGAALLQARAPAEAATHLRRARDARRAALGDDHAQTLAAAKWLQRAEAEAAAAGAGAGAAAGGDERGGSGASDAPA